MISSDGMTESGDEKTDENAVEGKSPNHKE
jgi:hypothetical protein